MGFGKRGVTPTAWPASRPSSEEDDAGVELRVPRNANAQGGASGVLVGVALTIAGIVAGIGGALLHSSWSPGGGASSAVAAQPSLRGAHARIADICMPPLPPPGSTLRRIDQSDEEFRYKRALTSREYFTCALVRERERFCAAGEKATLVEELLAYFGHIAARQQIYDKFAGDRTAKVMMKMADAVEGDGVSARRQRPQADASVVALIQDLVREGYLGAGDFGWFAPREIEPYLAGVEPVKAPC